MFETLPIENGCYVTRDKRASITARVSPTAAFYCYLMPIVVSSYSRAKHGRYDTAQWSNSSLRVLEALERVGVRFEVRGIDNYRNLAGPCVFVSNHMSTLETFILPCLIAPYREVTFVVKQSLVDYPVFKYVMRSRNPVTVTRTNPREDLRAVLEGGAARLRDGTSMVVFPQTTRSEIFDRRQFNTIGVKLAKKAGVPVLPVALKTDAWANGRYIKDFGRIDPSKKAYFSFGPPIHPDERGAAAHEAVIEFIIAHLREWGGKIVDEAGESIHRNLEAR